MTYSIRFVHYILLRDCKAVILIKHYRSDIWLQRSESVRKGDREIIESGDRSMRQTQRRFSNESQAVESCGDIHGKAQQGENIETPKDVIKQSGRRDPVISQ